MNAHFKRKHTVNETAMVAAKHAKKMSVAKMRVDLNIIFSCLIGPTRNPVLLVSTGNDAL
jgi:hypothetical protein